MSGALELARAQLPRLAEPADEQEAFMAARIQRMLARADFIAPAAALDDHDLRGWHVALTGGLLLTRSPHGLDGPMRGRYAFVQDSLRWQRAAIDALREVLDTFGLTPPRVLLLPERGSEALGRATAQALGLPAVEFAPDRAGLVAAYDLSRLPHPAQVALRHHQPEQILWAHAVCWTRPPICTPDVSTFLYQFNTAPWERQLAADGPDIPSVEGTAEHIAQAILAAAPEDEDPDPAARAALHQHLAGAADLAAPALRREGGLREKLWLMGPVPSNRFS